MQVVLNQDVKGIGKKGEVKRVANGHARNFLIPRNLVAPATRKNIQMAKISQKEEEQAKKQQKEKVQKLVDKIKDQKIIFEEKAKDGKLFGSVDKGQISQKIRQQLKDQFGEELKGEIGVAIERPFKETGEWVVKVNFGKIASSEIQVIIKEK